MFLKNRLSYIDVSIFTIGYIYCDLNLNSMIETSNLIQMYTNPVIGDYIQRGRRVIIVAVMFLILIGIHVRHQNLFKSFRYTFRIRNT